MRRYETIIIMDPDLSAEQREPVLKRVQDVIGQENGYLALTDDWGARKLAYEIKKKERGYYTRFDFCGTAAAVDEMERFFRIDDRVLKYMTVLLDKTADIEKIKDEIASALQTKAAPPEADQSAATDVPPETPDTAESKASEEKIESADDPAPEEPAEVEKAQTLKTDADESEADPGDAKEEIK